MATMPLLEMVREVRGRLGQPIPANVAGSTDPSVIQMMGIMNEFLDDLTTRKFWQAVTRQATFTTVADELQGTLDTLFPYGFMGVIPDTFFDRTRILKVAGSLSAPEWAARKAMNMSGPLPAYRIRGNDLLFNPVPSAGWTMATEYFSCFFVYNPADPTPIYRKYWLKDTDTCVLGDTLGMAYLKWAWLKAKGLDYAEDFRKYETLCKGYELRDTSPQDLSMDNDCGRNYGPGIFVSPGSWPV
jgi:hypothetical protein